jgi:hypothetical protein
MSTRRALFGALLLTLSTALAAGPVAAQPFPARVDLPDGFMPEGITHNGPTIYVGSLANGAIWRGDVRTGDGDVFIEGAEGRVAVGVDYESGARRLWVAGGPTGEVRVYDASDGTLLQTYKFSGAGFLNDLVVTRTAVYVTDSSADHLDVIPLGADGALPAPNGVTTLRLGGDFEVVPKQFNANGIVATRGSLIVVNTQVGKLYRVDPATGNATAIAVEMADGEPYSVTFGDGLELRGTRTLYVMRNQLELVAVLNLAPDLASARVEGELDHDLSIPTTAAFASGRLWVVNARFNLPVTNYWVTQLPAQP